MSKLKNVKIILLSIIFALFLAIGSCYAVDLDLSDDLIENISSSNSTNSNNFSTNENSTNTSTYTNINSSTNTNSLDEDYYTDNTSSTNTSTNSTPSATITNSLPESDLGLSNILNIFLIVIGVLLILLSIAILIRLKK